MELPEDVVCSILLKVFDQSSKDFGNYRLVNKEIERISKSSFVLKKSTNWCLFYQKKTLPYEQTDDVH